MQTTYRNISYNEPHPENVYLNLLNNVMDQKSKKFDSFLPAWSSTYVHKPVHSQCRSQAQTNSEGCVRKGIRHKTSDKLNMQIIKQISIPHRSLVLLASRVPVETANGKKRRRTRGRRVQRE